MGQTVRMGAMEHSEKQNRQPAMLFFYKDWLAAGEITKCSPGTRGIWFDMLCHMAMANPYGIWEVKDDNEAAKLCRCTEGEYRAAIAEMKKHTVYGELPDGRICCRRMYREGQIREERRKAGKLGADVRWHGGQKAVGKRKRLTEFPQEIQDLTGLLEAAIRENVTRVLPEFKPHKIGKWRDQSADAIDKLNRLDEVAFADIEAAIIYARDDKPSNSWPGWICNILSGRKLRKQYSTLAAKIGRRGRPGNIHRATQPGKYDGMD